MAQNFETLRNKMVEEQLVKRKIKSEAVLEAMRTVPRHLFVPKNMQNYAYNDSPLPIGLEQTISQPYIVAYMTELLEPKADMKIPEIGTGSGYQAAFYHILAVKSIQLNCIKNLLSEQKQYLTI